MLNMALKLRRLEDCQLVVEPLPNDNWLAIFSHNDGYEWSACVTVQNGKLVQSSTSLDQMRLTNGHLEPFSYIEEQGQEQRILDAISQKLRH
jgi:hypothetical protein